MIESIGTAIRWFLLLLLLLSVALVSQQALSQQATGRVGAFSLPNSPWDIQWQRFISNTERSGLNLEYFIRGELGSEEVMLTALKRNRLQIAGISLQGIASVVPEINVAMTPFLFRSEEEVDFVYDTVLLQNANALLESHGLVLLRWLESGWFSIGSQKSIRVPQDIRGLRIGGSPNRAIQRFLSSAGADAIPIASVDLVQALQTGLIDGAIKPTALIYANLRDEIDSVSLLKVAYDTGGLLANKAWASGLSKEEYDALINGHGPSIAVRGEVRDMVVQQIEMLQDLGRDIVELNDTEQQEWENHSRAVHEGIINDAGPQAQAVYDDIQAAIAQYRASQGTR